MSDFEIKRGMCFFIENPAETEPVTCESNYAPQKKRPYMVLSNNKCNQSSNLIHVAPVISRDYDPRRWYCVPFKSSTTKSSVVDVSAIMLIDKSLCTPENYATYISDATLNNYKLMENISVAIMRQFALDSFGDSYKNYDIATKDDVVKINNTKASIPEIHITVNVNGTPTTATVSATVEKEQLVSETNNEVVSESRNTKPVHKIAKAVEEKKVEQTEKVSTDDSIIRGPGKHYTKDQKEMFFNFIIKNSRKFSGKMCVHEIAEKLGISDSAVTRYIDILKKQKSDGRLRLPKELRAKFFEDYTNFGTKYILNNYNKYGFRTSKQVYDAAKRYKLSKKR